MVGEAKGCRSNLDHGKKEKRGFLPSSNKEEVIGALTHC